MSDRIGFLYYGDDPARKSMWLDLPGAPDYSQTTAQVIDEEVRRFVDEAVDETRRLLEENRSKIEDIAQGLLKYETLDAGEVEKLIKGESLDKPTVNDLLDAADTDDRSRVKAKEAPKQPPPEPELGSGPLPQPG
jgi:cell division protease FtsH